MARSVSATGVLFLILVSSPASAESWRDFILDEEACVEDALGRLQECDFEGYSEKELRDLLKEVLESKTLNEPQECKNSGSGDVAVMTKDVSAAPSPNKPQAVDPECAKVVDGMDVVIPNTGVRLIFSTPIFVGTLPKMQHVNDHIAKFLHNMEKSGQRTQKRKSAKGNGFRSDDNFLQTQTPQIKELMQHIQRFANHVWQFGRSKPFSQARLEIRGWANIMRQGAHHTVHVHPGAVWSGVYYVKVPKGVGDLDKGYVDNSQGCLVFMDPRHGIQMTTVNNNDSQFVDKMEVCPATGMIVMFPAWLSHFVPYLELQEERIAVSFNVHAVPLA